MMAPEAASKPASVVLVVDQLDIIGQGKSWPENLIESEKARTWPVRRWFFKMARLIMRILQLIEPLTKRDESQSQSTANKDRKTKRKHGQRDRDA